MPLSGCGIFTFAVSYAGQYTSFTSQGLGLAVHSLSELSRPEKGRRGSVSPRQHAPAKWKWRIIANFLEELSAA